MDADYEPRFLEGLRLFNEREFFACHDVLEDLWGETLGSDREFYQGLIHAAVALFHFEGGNLGGARKMYGSACRYLLLYGEAHQGLEIRAFLDDLRHCFAELLNPTNEYPAGVTLDPSRIPVIRINQVVIR